MLLLFIIAFAVGFSPGSALSSPRAPVAPLALLSALPGPNPRPPSLPFGVGPCGSAAPPAAARPLPRPPLSRGPSGRGRAAPGGTRVTEVRHARPRRACSAAGRLRAPPAPRPPLIGRQRAGGGRFLPSPGELRPAAPEPCGFAGPVGEGTPPGAPASKPRAAASALPAAASSPFSKEPSGAAPFLRRGGPPAPGPGGSPPLLGALRPPLPRFRAPSPRAVLPPLPAVPGAWICPALARTPARGSVTAGTRIPQR